MSMTRQVGQHGKSRTRVASGDVTSQRAANAEAPEIPFLLRRIMELFGPFRVGLTVTMLLVIVTAALAIVPPLLIQRAFDEGLFPHTATGSSEPPNFSVLSELVIIMIVVYLVSALLGVWQTWLTATIGNRVMGRLRVRLFTRLQSMELNFFTHTRTGVIQSRLQNDVGGVANVVTNTVSSVVGNTVQVLSAGIAMVILNWQLIIIAVIFMPFMVIAQRRVGQVRARIATKTQESLSEMSAITQETLSISGILLPKSFNRQASEIERYAGENANQIQLQVRQQMTGQWFFAMVSVFMSAIPAIVYLIAGLVILSHAAPVSAGTIVAFTTVQARLLFPLIALMRVALDLQTSRALFARIFEYIDLVPAIVDAPLARSLATTAPLGRIRFDGVWFRYPSVAPDAPATLTEVSFSVEPGQFAAFVGPSGAGKSTIVQLVPRLYEVTAGTITCGGIDVREFTRESLVDRIGIVTQETYLFHASIRDNLRYARPDASEEELMAAVRSANLHDFIGKVPEGLGTIVGERGHRLSGGEKQRVAIARVLLKDPELLILDEATSALDTISERIVQRALDDAARGRTTIAVAHRLSTVVSADVIFVLHEGRIVERGTHEELLRADGLYTSLYRQQERGDNSSLR